MLKICRYREQNLVLSNRFMVIVLPKSIYSKNERMFLSIFNATTFVFLKSMQNKYSDEQSLD